jgi:lysophospholipase L1-like esterase
MPDIGSRDPHKFFGYGDSITEGSQKYNGGWIHTVGYREALELALAAFFGDALVGRAYIPAGSTYDGVAQIQDDIAETDSGYLLLLFGAIDAGETDMDAEESAANVITMADYASQTLQPNMIVVIGTVPPSRYPDRDARIQLLNAEITEQADQEGYLLADHYTAMVEDAAGQIDSLVSEDGIHPSDRGYSVMAQVWFETIIGSETYPLPNEFYLLDPSRRRTVAHAR